MPRERATHCPHPAYKDNAEHQEPFCRYIKGATLAKPGERITCGNCIGKYGGEVYAPTQAAMVASPEETVREAGCDVREVTSLGLRMLVRERKVRVTRTLNYYADGNAGVGGTLEMKRTLVVFKGSEAAFDIWARTHKLEPADVVERRAVRYEGGCHNVGFGPIDTSAMPALLPLLAIGPDTENPRAMPPSIYWSPTRPPLMRSKAIADALDELTADAT